MTKNITFDLIVSSLLESYTKFIINILQDHKIKSTEGLLRMMLNVDVHIKMTTLVKANMKREEERSKVMAKLNFESHPIP